MADYTYLRVYANGKWNIDNPNDVNADGRSVRLSTRIVEGLPADTLFKMTLNETECILTFERELTTEEQIQLDQIVIDHEAATGAINLANSITLCSPDGTLYKVSVDNQGLLVTKEQ